jgi:hypothetical protein
MRASHVGSDCDQCPGVGNPSRAPGLAHGRIILSAKVSGVQDLIDVYRVLAVVATTRYTWA